MAYTPTNWVNGDLITSEKLNHIEQGIVNAGDAIAAVNVEVRNMIPEVADDVTKSFTVTTPSSDASTYFPMILIKGKSYTLTNGTSAACTVAIAKGNGTNTLMLTGSLNSGASYTFTVPDDGYYYIGGWYNGTGTVYVRGNSFVAPAIIDTVTGAVATFTDGADNYPVQSLVVDIDPVQASGTPAPDNVLPISGWTGAKVSVAGKNLLKNIAYLVNPTIIMLGQTENYWTAQRTFLKAGEYVFSFYSATAAGAMYWGQSNYIDGQTIVAGRNTLAVTVQEDGYYAFWIYGTDINAADYSNAQVELGTTVSDYEPYAGNIYNISFPAGAGTVYGGTLNATTGVLAVDKKLANDFSTTQMARQVGGNGYYFNFLLPDDASENNVYSGIVSNILPTNNFDSLWAGNSDCCCIRGNVFTIYVDDLKAADETTARAWLVNNSAQVLYPLASPVSYSCTPAEVRTLLGLNNVFADTGDVAVNYCADTKLYINKAIAAALANS